MCDYCQGGHLNQSASASASASAIASAIASASNQELVRWSRVKNEDMFTCHQYLFMLIYILKGIAWASILFLFLFYTNN